MNSSNPNTTSDLPQLITRSENDALKLLYQHILVYDTNRHIESLLMGTLHRDLTIATVAREQAFTPSFRADSIPGLTIPRFFPYLFEQFRFLERYPRHPVHLYLGPFTDSFPRNDISAEPHVQIFNYAVLTYFLGGTSDWRNRNTVTGEALLTQRGLVDRMDLLNVSSRLVVAVTRDMTETTNTAFPRAGKEY